MAILGGLFGGLKGSGLKGYKGPAPSIGGSLQSMGTAVASRASGAIYRLQNIGLNPVSQPKPVGIGFRQMLVGHNGEGKPVGFAKSITQAFRAGQHAGRSRLGLAARIRGIKIGNHASGRDYSPLVDAFDKERAFDARSFDGRAGGERGGQGPQPQPDRPRGPQMGPSGAFMQMVKDVAFGDDAQQAAGMTPDLVGMVDQLRGSLSRPHGRSEAEILGAGRPERQVALAGRGAAAASRVMSAPALPKVLALPAPPKRLPPPARALPAPSRGADMAR